MITFLIVTYKSEKIIRKCLSDLPEVSKKIIIENSGNVKLKEELLREFKNLKVIKFGGFLFVLGYFVYILFLANIF